MLDGVWLPLAVKMVATGLVVVTGAAAAERSGPFLGGLISSLPVAAGPAYVFLALDGGPDFVADSALASLVTNAAIPPYILVFTRLAPRSSTMVSVGGALGIWLALVLLARQFAWTVVGACLLNALSVAVCGALLRLPAVRGAPRGLSRWYDLPVRAALVGLLVAGVVGLSKLLGPSTTGTAAVFPIAFTCLAFVLHRRIGGAAAAATLGHALVPMIGFAFALLSIHLLIPHLGLWPGLGIGLLVSLGWSAALLACNVRR